MNQNNYQLVFNAARGCIMVVSEAAQRCAKGGGSPAGQNVRGAGGIARSAVFSLALTAVSAALVQAQIVADPTAPGNQRPTVLGTPNGAPLVNIQTPSAAGVSRNTYQQFDVGAPGAVLNNSRTSVQTQLGGWVQGNPWLVTGEARIILNEVNSQNPSYLNGFIEVAGRRAEVIIANPAGINVNGAGFINASRATLTTGTPVMNGGNLEAYRVQRGTISINGKGLNAALTDYTGILARAIEVNASIHAQQLHVVAGVGTVDAQQHELQSGAASFAQGTAPMFALDVSELGGMYAGHIRLVGNEAGVGVRNHGTLAASVGDVNISTNGWLSSAGHIEARQGHMTIQTAGQQIHNGGLVAAGNLSLHSGNKAQRQAILNTGTVRAGLETNIRASDLNNSGQIDAKRLDVAVANLTNSGDIWQSGAQALDVQAGQLVNHAGAALGRVVAASTPSTPDTPTSLAEPQESNAGAGQAGDAAGRTPPTNSSQPQQPAQPQLAAGQVRVGGQLLQQEGSTLAAEGDLQVWSLASFTNEGDVRVHTLQAQGESFVNSAGTVQAQHLDVQTQQATVQGGSVWAQVASIDTEAFALDLGAQLYAQTALELQADTLDNAGSIQSGASAHIHAAHGLNNSGTLAAATNLTLLANSLNNTNGQTLAGWDLLAQVTTTLNNTSGAISAQRHVVIEDTATAAQANAHDLQARQLHVLNTQGSIVTNSATAPQNSGVFIAAKSLHLGDGTLHSGGDMALDLVGSLDTQAGQEVRTGRHLSVELHSTSGGGSNTFNNAGHWQAGQNLSIRADHIDNQASGKLDSQGVTTLNTSQHTSGSVTNCGLVDGVDTRMTTHTLTNVGTGRVYGDRVAIAAHTVMNREETLNGVTQAATIAARDRLDIGAQHLTNLEGALIFSAGNMAIGGALDDNHRAIVGGSANAHTLNNNSATIESLGNMALAADVLRNTNEHFESQLFVIDGPRNLTLIQPSRSTARISTDNLWTYSFSRAWGYRYLTDPNPVEGAVTVLGQTPIPGVGEETCSDWDDPTTCSRQPGADYLRDDPAWSYFGLNPPELGPLEPALQQPQAPELAQPSAPQAPDTTAPSSCEQGSPSFDAATCQVFEQSLAQAQVVYQAAMNQYQQDQQAYDAAWNQYQTLKDAYDSAWAQYHSAYEQWDDLTEDLYETLDQKITAYNRQFAGNLITHWTQYNITRTERESKVTQSAPGQILAGGSLSLRGQNLLNDKSRIIVGQTLQGDVDNLDNRQAFGQNVVNETGTTQGSWTYTRRGGKLKTGRKRTHRDFSGHSPYNPPDVVTTITLNVTEKKENTQPVGSGTQLASRGQTSGVQAARAVNVLTNPSAGLGAPNAPALVLPNSSLFTIHPGSSARFLVETDPRFTNYRQWLSSDYLLTASGFQPEAAQKRLGDGFYEQKLIREQVAALTGHRFLGNYRSDEAQYMALMNAGATFAQAQQLRPGIALSAAQVAQLTSDIVWLVAQTVQLPDGSTTTALVSQVYLAPRQGDLAANGLLHGGPGGGGNGSGSGSLISARDIELALSGDLSNSGTIAGRNLVDISAHNIANSGRIQGRTALLNAEQDIVIEGGSVTAQSGMVVNAGRNLTVATTTQGGSSQAGGNTFSQQGIDRVAGLYVSGPAGVLLASAGHNITLAAAQVHSAGTGTTQLQAGNDFTLASVETGQSHNITWNAHNYHRQSSSAEVGSSISGGGAVSIQAQNDIQARAAQINAQGALSLQATEGNITLEAGLSSQSLADSQRSVNRGTFSRTTTTRTSNSQSITAQASELGGQTVAITSGADTRIVGSNVLGDEGLTINAGGDLSIEAAQNTASSSSFTQTRRSGMFSSGGLGITIGSQQQSTDAQNQRTTAAASTVGAIDGNVNLNAAQIYTQRGSDVLAPGGDVNISAQQVNIEEARESSRQSVEQRARQSGLTVAITSPVVNAVQTIDQQIDAAGYTQSSRMQALAAANAGLAGFDAYQQVQAGRGQNIHGKDGQILTGKTEADGTPITRDANMADKVGGFNLSVSLGSSRSQSNQSSSADTARSSSVTAGGNVNISASGAGPNSDITIQGSSVQAGGTTRLSAEDEVRLLAAANTRTESNTNRSSSASVGVSMGVGGQNAGLSLNASASRAQGQGSGAGTSYTHTQVGGQSVQIESGGDTTLKGAVVSANQVSANVGGNLHIETVQDTNRYDERQRNAGFNVSVPIGSGTASGDINAGRTDVRSNYQNAAEQSGIRAGDGGFQVKVDGQTTLVGGALTSSELAVQDAGVNHLQTATLSSSDLHNTASASASSSGISLGTDMVNQGRYGLAKTGVANLANQASDQTQQQGQTISAISSANTVITDKARHQALTSETSEQTAERLQANAQGTTHTGVSAADVQAMRRQVEAERAIKNEAVKQLTNLTDQAWKTMFTEQPKFYSVSCPAGVDCIANPELAQVKQVLGTPDEVQKQIAAAEAGAVLAVNGIENPLGRAAQLAFQNAAVDKESGDKPSTIYLMHYVPATNALAEMMVAGYEKNLASTLGHSNQTQAYAQALAERGTQETTSLGHSRGTIVQTNANHILAQQGHTNPNLSVQGVGGAVDQRTYFEAAAAVQGDVEKRERDRITYSHFSNDAVSTSRLSGGNPGAWRLSDLWQMLTTSNSMHSCYGTGAQGCTQVQNPVPGGPQGTPEGNAKLIEYRGGELYNRNSNQGVQP